MIHFFCRSGNGVLCRNGRQFKVEGRALPATEIEKTAQRRPQVKRARIFDGPVEQAVKDLVAALCADGIL